MAGHGSLTSAMASSASAGFAVNSRDGVQTHPIMDDVLKTVLVDFHVRKLRSRERKFQTLLLLSFHISNLSFCISHFTSPIFRWHLLNSSWIVRFDFFFSTSFKFLEPKNPK